MAAKHEGVTDEPLLRTLLVLLGVTEQAAADMERVGDRRFDEVAAAVEALRDAVRRSLERVGSSAL